MTQMKQTNAIARFHKHWYQTTAVYIQNKYK